MKSPSISRVVLLGIIINDKLLNGIAYITLLCKTFKQAKRVLIFLQTVKNSQPDLWSKLMGHVTWFATSNKLICQNTSLVRSS